VKHPSLSPAAVMSRLLAPAAATATASGTDLWLRLGNCKLLVHDRVGQGQERGRMHILAKLGNREAPEFATGEAALLNARRGRRQGGCERLRGEAGGGRRQVRCCVIVSARPRGWSAVRSIHGCVHSLLSSKRVRLTTSIGCAAPGLFTLAPFNFLVRASACSTSGPLRSIVAGDTAA